MTTSELSKAVNIVKLRQDLQRILDNDDYELGLAYKLPLWGDYDIMFGEDESKEWQKVFRDFVKQMIDSITKELESFGVTD